MIPPHLTKKTTITTTQSSQGGSCKIQKRSAAHVEEEAIADNEEAEEMDVDNTSAPETSQTPNNSDLKLQKLVVDMVDVVC
jgi:hypothetical protein